MISVTLSPVGIHLVLTWVTWRQNHWGLRGTRIKRPLLRSGRQTKCAASKRDSGVISKVDILDCIVVLGWITALSWIQNQAILLVDLRLWKSKSQANQIVLTP